MLLSIQQYNKISNNHSHNKMNNLNLILIKIKNEYLFV